MAFLSKQLQALKKKLSKISDNSNLGIAKNTVLGLPEAFKKVSGTIGKAGLNLGKSLASPIAETGVKVAQATDSLRGVKPKDIVNPWTKAPIKANETRKELLGRAAKTVSLGLGPAIGSAGFLGGEALSKNKPLLPSRKAPLDNVTSQTILGGAGGKVLDVGLKASGGVLNKFAKALSEVPRETIPGTTGISLPKKIPAGLSIEDVSKVPLKDVADGIDPVISAKVNRDNPKVVSMVEALKRGEELPPVPVYQKSSGKYELNKDGYHRRLAHEIAGKEDINVKLEPKTDLTSTAKQQLERGLVESKSAQAKSIQTPLLQRKTKSSQLENNLSSKNESTKIDPVQAITQALKESKPLRKEQEALYRAERSKRLARVAGVGENTPGEKGYFAQLGQLKGELPKVQLESIRKQISQDGIDGLFQTVQDSRILTEFEKVSTKGALAKLLGAEGVSLPTRNELSLLSEVFPKEMIDAILSRRTTMEKLWSGTKEALNLPRAIMSTVDLSAPLRQGIFTMARNPKIFSRNFKNMFKYALNEKAYNGAMESIQARPTYKLMRENKLALTDMSKGMTSREEAFMTNLAERIPGFGVLARGSNRAYSGFLNKMRADVFDSMLASAKQAGILAEHPEVARSIASFVNTATGRGNLPGGLNKAQEVLNGVFFSPRLMASRLSVLNPVYYVKLDPFVRKEALKSLIAFAGLGSTILGMAKLAGAEVGVDPRSADFGKIKIGNTRYDPWGGFQQYMVLGGRLISGEMVSSTTGKEFTLGEGYKATTRLDIISRFLQSKESPVASFLTGWLKGKDAIGGDFKITPEIIDRMMPMMANDLFDLIKEYGAKGVPMGLPGIFGVGSQTYSDQVPLSSKTPTGQDSITWRNQPSLGETIVNKITSQELSDVPEDEWPALQEERRAKTLRDIELDKIKAEVLETGETQELDGTTVYLDNGVVKTSTTKDPEEAEMYVKVKDIYQQAQDLKIKGDGSGAQTLADGLSDDEYDIYKSVRSTERAKITKELRELLDTNVSGAVSFLRSQTLDEQQRLLNVMTDEEYAIYQEGKQNYE